MNNLENTVDILRKLIAFPTVSADSNLQMIDYLAERLESAGAKVDIFHNDTKTKANLFATIGPETDGGIVLSGHSDVVPAIKADWSHDPFDMIQRDGKLFGRGACDMKGFIAATVALAPLLAEKIRNRPVHFAFTYDEEVGCLGGQALVDSLQVKDLKPNVAIIGEPTSMRIIEGHKGCCEYTTHFTGRAGHGSTPDLGVNAVEYAVRYVTRLLQLGDTLRQQAPKNSPFDPPWTTINTGSLNGGVAHNVIASHASVEWEMRPVNDTDGTFVRKEMRDYVHDQLLPAMRAVWPDASIHTDVIGEVVGLMPVDDNQAKQILMALTGQNSASTVPFGTEAGLFQGMGMDVVVCGPGSIEQAHKPDEFVSLNQLSQCVSMLEKLADTLAVN